MSADKDLHLSEEFNKAKRNLLWFCSFAILLSVVTFSKGSGPTAPLLGQGAQVDLLWLRIFAGLACIYAVVGFWRQTRNVDRLNSAALYVSDIDRFGARLQQIDEAFEQLSEQLQRLVPQAENVRFVPAKLMNEFASQITQIINSHTDELNRLFSGMGRIPENEMRVYVTSLPDRWLAVREGLNEALTTPLNDMAAAYRKNDEELETLKGVAAIGKNVSSAVLSMQGEFQKLSDQILGEHKLMYQWYDKYLGYCIFVVAMAVTAYGLAPSFVAAFQR